MRDLLIAVGWILLIAMPLLLMADWELTAILAVLLAGAAFVVAAWMERRNGTVAR